MGIDFYSLKAQLPTSWAGSPGLFLGIAQGSQLQKARATSLVWIPERQEPCLQALFNRPCVPRALWSMSKMLVINHLAASLLFSQVCSKKTLRDWLEGQKLPPLVSPVTQFLLPKVQSRIELSKKRKFITSELCSVVARTAMPQSNHWLSRDCAKRAGLLEIL